MMHINKNISLRLWSKDAPYAMGESAKDAPYLDVFPVSSIHPTSGVIICPGGAYQMRAEHEGAPVASWLNQIGITAFVLHYRVAPYRHPVPFLDAQRAIRYVRHYARQLNIDPYRIGILGFSAGGHLAATTGTHFDQGDPFAKDPIDRESSRPDIMVLSYPVITLNEVYTHQGSVKNLLGENPSEVLRYNLSNETQVRPFTPPAFIWHTADDAAVPVENSLMFANALSRYKIPFELHVFETGQHGLGLAASHPLAYIWTQLCENWLRQRGF